MVMITGTGIIMGLMHKYGSYGRGIAGVFGFVDDERTVGSFAFNRVRGPESALVERFSPPPTCVLR